MSRRVPPNARGSSAFLKVWVLVVGLVGRGLAFEPDEKLLRAASGARVAWAMRSPVSVAADMAEETGILKRPIALSTSR